MHRAIISAAVALVVAATVAVGASASSGSSSRATADSVTLRIHYKTGPWLKTLKLPLNLHHLKEFTLCAVYNWPGSKAFTCNGAGPRLPERTVIRMEQTPIANSLKRRDSRWGLAGMVNDPVFRLPLTNTITGDKWGTYYYRATLRDLASGKVLATSNRVKLVWHKP